MRSASCVDVRNFPSSPLILGIALFCLVASWLSFSRHPNTTWVAGLSPLCLDFNGTDYIAIVKTKTDPSFFISLHREKDDTPRAPIMYTGTYYETVKTKQMRELMSMADNRMQGIFLDVGANIGWFTLYLAALGRHVVAFEPNPMNALRLRQSIQANGFQHVVILKTSGAGPSNTVLKFRSRKTNFGMGTFVHNLTEDAKDVTSIHVNKVDDELKDLPRDWNRRVALVKIDVEGFEADALEGMIETLRKDKPLVYLEFNNVLPSSGKYYETIWSFLRLGYRMRATESEFSMGTSLDELREWFKNVVHSAKGPSDFLFLPSWCKDNELPF